MCDMYNRIHELAIQQGFNDAQLCSTLGEPASMLSDLKNDKKKSLSLEKLFKVAELLGTTMDYLYSGKKEKAHPQIEDELDKELIQMLKSLNESDALQIRAFVSGLIANRKG